MQIDTQAPLPSFITIITCTRGNRTTEETIRKFVAGCGTKIVVYVSMRGKIKHMEPEDCRYGLNCSECESRMKKIRELIDNGR
jgi:hypothetical protein